MTELETKLQNVYRLIEKHGLGALLLRRVSSFAWATCGSASYINIAASDGGAALLITPKKRFVLTNNIEAPRIEKEEKLADQGWEIHASGWYEAPESIARLVGVVKIGADGPLTDGSDLSDEVARLRANLTLEEVKRFRVLGRQCAEIMDTAIRRVEPGMSEFQIAALLAESSQSQGVQGIVNLIAVDDRIFQFRHPLPTDRRLERYAMLVFCGRRYGLVCSITRLIHFGRLPDELERKSIAVAQVDATMIANTRPGTNLGQIFTRTQAAYGNVGYADEWKLHHQGGSAGYEPREYIATPESNDLVRLGQAYAWNPSITGTKSEDTILVGESENEVITWVPDWPGIKVTIGDQTLVRPGILEIV